MNIRRFPGPGERVILKSGVAAFVERSLGPDQGIVRLFGGRRIAVSLDQIDRIESVAPHNVEVHPDAPPDVKTT